MDLDRAITIATEAHTGQLDQAGADYILHPLRVKEAVSTEDEKIVAVLHGVIEDCPGWAFQRLEAEGFSPGVIEAVRLVTKVESEPHDAFVQRAASNPVARAVKFAELRDNSDLSRLPAPTEKDMGGQQEVARLRGKPHGSRKDKGAEDAVEEHKAAPRKRREKGMKSSCAKCGTPLGTPRTKSRGVGT